MTTGEMIKIARTMVGMSQKELGRLCGLDAGMICNLERGTRDWLQSTLRQVAEALDVPLYLFFLADEQTDNPLRDALLADELLKVIKKAG